MALGAAPFDNRFVPGNVFLLTSHRVVMALVAELCRRFAQQPLDFGGMRVMAGKTTLPAQQRPVHSILVKGPVDHVIVATTAEPDSIALDLKRCSRRSIHVALVAHAFGNRRMHVLVQQSRAVRSMRIVATGTESLADRVIHMFFYEQRLVALMAAQAEQIDFALQQIRSLIRSMGLVTGEAAAFHRRMPILDFGECLAKRLVTAEAERLAILEQTVLVVGGMGVVALHATAIGHHLVDTAWLGGNHRRMTERTDSFCAGLKQLAMGGGMGVVAAGTIFLFQRCVDHLTGQLLLETVMAVKAQVAPCSGLELQLLIGAGRQALPPDGQHNHGQ